MLQVARNFRVRIDETGQLLGSISQSSGEFCLTPEVLVLLGLVAESKLAEPRMPPLASQLKKRWADLGKGLPPANELEGLIADLKSAGVLVDTKAADQGEIITNGLQADGFGDPWVQWTMVADRHRTLAYKNAIEATLKRGDVVVDVGAGTGLLGLMALQAGAERVVAIEETAAAGFALATAKQLGFSKKKYQLIQSNSFDATIPPETRVIVSELFGNDPFQEGVVPTLRNIAMRFQQKKSIVFIPHSFECFVEVVDVIRCPQLPRIIAYQSQAKSMKLADNKTNELITAVLSELRITELSFPCHFEKGDFTIASMPVSLGTVSLNMPSSTHLKFHGRVDVDVNARTTTPALLLWYRVYLTKDKKHTLSSSPVASDYAEHWSPILIPFNTNELKPGIVSVEFQLSEQENFLELNVSKNKARLGGR